MFRAFLAMSCASLVGCMTFPVTPPEHRAAVSDDWADRVTVGRVQKEIRIGMSGAQVAAVLGSPNIVTTDEQHREPVVDPDLAMLLVGCHDVGRSEDRCNL